jgi:hypothetical protein
MKTTWGFGIASVVLSAAFSIACSSEAPAPDDDALGGVDTEMSEQCVTGCTECSQTSDRPNSCYCTTNGQCASGLCSGNKCTTNSYCPDGRLAGCGGCGGGGGGVVNDSDGTNIYNKGTVWKINSDGSIAYSKVDFCSSTTAVCEFIKTGTNTWNSARYACNCSSGRCL